MKLHDLGQKPKLLPARQTHLAGIEIRSIPDPVTASAMLQNKESVGVPHFQHEWMDKK